MRTRMPDWRWRLVLLLMSVLSCSPPAPAVATPPCPRAALRYQQDGWTGVLRIARPRPRILRVELSVPGALSARVSGSLRPDAGSGAAISYVLRLGLPATARPRITRIEAAGRALVCRSAPDPAPAALSTVVTFEHRIRDAEPEAPETPYRLFLQTDGRVNATAPAHSEEAEPQIECGTPASARVSPLVAAGVAATPGDWPWLVAVFTTTPLGVEFHCAGTLVSERHAVTAAHCVFQRAPDELVLSAGRHNVRKWTEPQAQTREVSRILVHPDFEALNLTSDLAVLELSEPVSYDWFVRPACVDWEGSTDLADVVGLVGAVVGWGRDEFGRRLTPQPHAANMPIVAQEVCLRSRPDFIRFTSERTFCAGFRNGSGPCNGDSGSGLLLPVPAGRWTLRGIVSLSLLDAEHRTCDLHHYVVFTDVAKFRDWLGLIMQQNSARSTVEQDQPPIWDTEPAQVPL